MPGAKHASPGIEDHDGLGAGGNLGVQIGDHGVGGHIQHPVHQVGAVIHHRLDFAEMLRALAFHHVGRQRPGAAGKANQRHAAVQCRTDGAHPIHDITQFFFRIGRGQFGDVRLGADRALEMRAFALREIQPQPHGVRHGQDVGKQNGRVQRETLQRLQGHFTGQFRIFAQRQKTARLGAGGAVFGQITARLAHQPDGRGVHRLTPQGAQQTVIVEIVHKKPMSGIWMRAGRRIGALAI